MIMTINLDINLLVVMGYEVSVFIIDYRSVG